MFLGEKFGLVGSRALEILQLLDISPRLGTASQKLTNVFMSFATQLTEIFEVQKLWSASSCELITYVLRAIAFVLSFILPSHACLIRLPLPDLWILDFLIFKEALPS